MWSQVHDFTATDDKVGKRGRLMVGVSMDKSQVAGLEMVTAGRDVLARMHELYFGNLDTDPLTALKQAAVTVTGEYSPLEIIALAVVKQALYVVVIGSGGVWLKTASQEGWIVNFQRSSMDPVAVSGWLTPDTHVVGGNSHFWQALTLGAVRAAVANGGNLGETAETLTTVVHGNDAGLGAVGIMIATPPAVVVAPAPKTVAPNLSKPKLNIKEIKSKLLAWAPKPAGPIFISHPNKERGRKHSMWLGIGFLILLLVLVATWQWRKGYLAHRSSERLQQIEEVVHNFNEAQALAELNPVRSRELLTQVTSQLESLKEQKIKDEQLIQIEANIGQVLGAASGVKTTPLETVMDLEWLRSGMVGTRLALLDGKLVVLDTQGDRLVVVDPGKKSGQVIAGQSDIGDAKLVATYPGKITVLSDKGLIECGVAGSCKSVVSEAGSGKDMAMFAGNVYLLTDAGISRFQVTDSGFSEAQDWLAEGEDTSVFGKSVSFAIDAFVWVGLADGLVAKYNRGVKENFTMLDLDKPVSSNPIIYTDEEAENLYILDKGNGRVVVVDKTGAYKSQYPSDQAREAADLVVDEVGSKGYLLVGSKIWQIAL